MRYHNLSEMNFNFSRRQNNFLKIIDNSSKLIREHEEQCYLDERINEKLVPVFKKIGMLGCPISTKYGGLGYDVLTYCLLWKGSEKKEILLGHSYQLTLQLGNWYFRGGLMKNRKESIFRRPQEDEA